ncbi:MAG: hypothetical protein P8J32_02860 [bacterium]|nr:hypothetical protein [bacterium]
MDNNQRLGIKEGDSQTSFGGNGDTHQFVIAEPHNTLQGAWVESKYSQKLRFEDKGDCKRFIELSKDIPSLFKATLRPKLISELHQP